MHVPIAKCMRAHACCAKVHLKGGTELTARPLAPNCNRGSASGCLSFSCNVEERVADLWATGSLLAPSLFEPEALLTQLYRCRTWQLDCHLACQAVGGCIGIAVWAACGAHGVIKYCIAFLMLPMLLASSWAHSARHTLARRTRHLTHLYFSPMHALAVTCIPAHAL